MLDLFNSSIAISYMSEFLRIKAQKLSEQLSVPLIQSSKVSKNNSIKFVLEFSDERLSLVNTSSSAPGPVFVDFIGGKIGHRRQQFTVKNQAILKAIGIKKGHRPTILDATAGLGQDSFIMAWAGCEVTAIERSPIIFALLEDGIYRGKDNVEVEPILNRIKVINSDSIKFIASINEVNAPDIIYLDPMFPHRKKSSLVKKEMRCLQEIVGEDADSTTLLELSLSTAKKRVVVKRPTKSDFLSQTKPSLSFKGKSTRFDVYLI